MKKTCPNCATITAGEYCRHYLVMGVLFLLVAARLAGHGTVPLEVQASLSAVNTGQADACIRLSPGIQAACRRIQADSGRELGERVVKNVGRAMFIFLPLLAGFMKLLYWRPRRYFLEHLILLLTALFSAVTL